MNLSINLLDFRLGLPAIAVALSISLPAQAATFTRARTAASFSNFNADLITLSKNTVADTKAIATGGAAPVANLNNAQALFQEEPAFIQTFVEGSSEGEGQSYLGLTEGMGSASGTFLVQENFSFDFSTLLEIESRVEHSSESAAATAGFGFSLFASDAIDTPGVLIDSFSLSGLVASKDITDHLALNHTSHITLAPNNCPPSPFTSCGGQSFGGLQEFAFASLNGFYSRTFEQPTYITLVETQFANTQVQSTPEGNAILSVLMLGIGVMIAGRRKHLLVNR